MSETPWTPGKWAASAPGDYIDYDGDCSVIIGDDTRVCVVLGSNPEARANADLIAAAPELAEACEAARAFISNGIKFGFIRMPETETDPAHTTLAKIFAALAKAKGETP
jgi:hypothetical protein